MTSPEEITRLLVSWGNGDQAALDQLMPLVYDELRRLATHYLRGERPDHTLQATALVHEAYLRLVDERKVSWQNRAHFFGIAARRMRHILVEHARMRKAAKRGGAPFKLSLSHADQVAAQDEVDLVELDDAMKKLEAVDPQKVQVVELRYFGGLTIEETGEVLKISQATVKRDWNLARAWLRDALGH